METSKYAIAKDIFCFIWGTILLLKNVSYILVQRLTFQFLVFFFDLVTITKTKRKHIQLFDIIRYWIIKICFISENLAFYLLQMHVVKWSTCIFSLRRPICSLLFLSRRKQISTRGFLEKRYRWCMKLRFPLQLFPLYNSI